MLAKGREMQSGTKTDLMNCILPDSTTSATNAQQKAAGAVLEGSVLVNLVNPKKRISCLKIILLNCFTLKFASTNICMLLIERM